MAVFSTAFGANASLPATKKAIAVCDSAKPAYSSPDSPRAMRARAGSGAASVCALAPAGETIAIVNAPSGASE
jgi:hypothetical protein